MHIKKLKTGIDVTWGAFDFKLYGIQTYIGKKVKAHHMIPPGTRNKANPLIFTLLKSNIDLAYTNFTDTHAGRLSNTYSYWEINIEPNE